MRQAGDVSGVRGSGARERNRVLSGPLRGDTWRRLVTGSIALALLALAWGGQAGIECERSASTESDVIPPDFGCGLVKVWWLIYISTPLTVIAVLFGSAALMPFGTLRRVVIGLGSSLLAIPAGFGVGALSIYLAVGAPGPTIAVGLLWGIGVSAVAFAAAYRLAR